MCTGGRRSSSAENVRGIPHEMCQLAIRTQLGKIGDHYFGPFPLIHTVYNSKCFFLRFPSVCTGVLCLMFFGVSSLQVGRSKVSQLPPAIEKMELPDSLRLSFGPGSSYTPTVWRELTTFWRTLQIRICFVRQRGNRGKPW